MSGGDDEFAFASPSGLPPGELAETLARSVVESGRGVSAAVGLLRRSGDWLAVLDAAGFIAIGPPNPRNPEPDPPARSIVRWAEAVAALEHPGVLADAARPHRRPHVLRLAAGLAGGVPVDLRAVLDGLHRDEARLVLAAISAATQGEFAEYEQRLPDGRDSGWSGAVDLGPLVPWPDPEPADLGEQPELDLFPARVAEERALAWALAHPAPSVSLPLDTNVRAVLDHLRFASGMRGHGLGRSLWRTEPVLEGRVVRADEEVAAWAGIDVPEITTP